MNSQCQWVKEKSSFQTDSELSPLQETCSKDIWALWAIAWVLAMQIAARQRWSQGHLSNLKLFCCCALLPNEILARLCSKTRKTYLAWWVRWFMFPLHSFKQKRLLSTLFHFIWVNQKMTLVLALPAFHGDSFFEGDGFPWHNRLVAVRSSKHSNGRPPCLIGHTQKTSTNDGFSMAMLD